MTEVGTVGQNIPNRMEGETFLYFGVRRDEEMEQGCENKDRECRKE